MKNNKKRTKIGGSDLPYNQPSGPEVIKLFSCSTQLSIKFVLLINLKLLTNSNFFLLNMTEHENFSANKYENANYSIVVTVTTEKISCSFELSTVNIL